MEKNWGVYHKNNPVVELQNISEERARALAYMLSNYDGQFNARKSLPVSPSVEERVQIAEALLKEIAEGAHRAEDGGDFILYTILVIETYFKRMGTATSGEKT
jgi:hypothetical protein